MEAYKAERDDVVCASQDPCVDLKICAPDPLQQWPVYSIGDIYEIATVVFIYFVI